MPISRKTNAAAAEVMVAAAARAVASTWEDVTVAESTEADFRPVAVAVGEAWAHELVCSLRSDDRAIIGAWPGTLREARMRLRVAVRSRLELHLVEELARIAYVAARRAWQEVSEVDPES